MLFRGMTMEMHSGERRTVCVLDMQGGKAGCHIGDADVSPVITKGRSSVNDVHVVCRVVGDVEDA